MVLGLCDLGGIPSYLSFLFCSGGQFLDSVVLGPFHATNATLFFWCTITKRAFSFLGLSVVNLLDQPSFRLLLDADHPSVLRNSK